MNRNIRFRELIIVFAPDGPNLKVVQDVLTKAGLACRKCDAADEFCRLLEEGVGAGIVFNEILTRENAACIRDFLQAQPPWSDLAIILFTRDLSMQIPYLEILGSHRNTITLELPIRTFALVGLLRSLLGARQRQYESRDVIHELEQTKEELLNSKTNLESKNKELETIIGIVSHDLRAPLVNVKGFSKEIARDCKRLHEIITPIPLEEKIKSEMHKFFHDDIPQSLRFIQSSAEAMDNLAVSLVSVARAGLEAISPEQLDMNEILRKVLDSIQFKFKQKNISYDIDANLPSCFADKTQITQIFTNLLDNAVKYLDPNRPGQICVRFEINAHHAMYSVSDNGIGILPHDQEKIFDPYYQLHEKAAGGIGLGLATVKRMVDRNNGKIWVYSEKDKGATFYVALPITPPHRRQQ